MFVVANIDICSLFYLLSLRSWNRTGHSVNFGNDIGGWIRESLVRPTHLSISATRQSTQGKQVGDRRQEQEAASVIIQLRTFSRTSFTADINLDRGSPRDERGSVPPRVSKKRRKTRSDQSSFCSARRRRTRDIPSISIRNAKWNSDYPSITESNHFVRTRSLGRLCGLGLPTLSTGRGCYPFVVAAGIPEAFKELEQDLSLSQSGRVGLKDTRIPSKAKGGIRTNRIDVVYRSDEQTSDKRGSENRNRRNLEPGSS